MSLNKNVSLINDNFQSGATRISKLKVLHGKKLTSLFP